ncbi:Fpg/Nei family DNA glycosylase [Georgenia sp. TF02-10]|uniref:Fpg/Nei family DNA glycosylase n=1 Tax=Georgenia sp. TF02-10 TaxID=2917725 RepID=UPI001FA73987|nr:zinc finger domain-containing protein [Georgenia sp. TF02-10]UNX55850.1 Fpg/Nei family DNA glycosylase [Georgenia sp. TF02-10]
MPEGHTVHRLAHAFAELFGGQRLAACSPQGRFAAGADLLDGRVLAGTEAHGKQLFLAFAPPDGHDGQDGQDGRAGPVPGDVGVVPGLVPAGAVAGPAGSAAGSAGGRTDDGTPAESGRPGAGAPTADLRWLRVHLGLYGSWTFDGDADFRAPHAIGAPRRRVAEEEVAVAAGTDQRDGQWSPPPPRGAVRLRLLGAHGVADLTGPTACEVVTPAEKAAVQARLGPDPLRPDGDAARFVAAVRARRRPVGELLMDQAVIAGVGNIYRAESLYRARVHPRRLGKDVPAARLRQVWADLAELMADGVRTGAIVTTRPEDRRSDADRWYVYHRTGEPCLVCGTRVQEAEMAGRRVFWCPRCQRAPRG